MLIPAWDEPPNVEVRFSRPVRLNLYPFDWFGLVQLTVDRPDEFLSSMQGLVHVDAHDANAMFRRAPGKRTSRELLAAVITLAIGLFVLSLFF
jgi:hypothetical protein